MMILGLAVLAAIVAVVWYVVRGATTGGRGGGPSRPVDAEEILRQRYARGEIDRETYLRMRDDLRRPSAD